MSAGLNFLAVDLGASSGRVMECRWSGDRFSLRECYRFPNGGVRLGSCLHWDVLRIWAEIQNGLRQYRALNSQTPAGIGIDGWGVDYCLLDERDRLLGNPYHYRDARTSGLLQKLQPVMDAHDLFWATGVQTLEINTSIQLASMVFERDRLLQNAHSLLMIPDFFQFLLCGERRAEYTEASTTQLYDLPAHCWSRQTMAKLGLPPRIFQSVVLPGAKLGHLLPAVQSGCGFGNAFPCIDVASHDTASAVAAIPGLDDDSVFLSSGTWSLLGVAASEPNLSDPFFEGGFTNGGAADGGFLLLKIIPGLWILQECARTWKADGQPCAWDELEEAARRASAFRSFIDPSAALFLAPAEMCTAVRAYCAQSGQPAPQTPGEIARCLFESLSLSYCAEIEKLERITGRDLGAIRVVGGGCLNRFLCQMTADACRRPVFAGPAEAAALGNAMVQAVSTGHIEHCAAGRQAIAASIEVQTYEPAPGPAWTEAFDRYQAAVGRFRKQNGN